MASQSRAPRPPVRHRPQWTPTAGRAGSAPPRPVPPPAATRSGGAFAGAGGYSNTPEGKILIAAFMDSYNQLVRAVRNYKAQEVAGGMGTGGALGVQGGSTPASKALDKPAPKDPKAKKKQ
mgnify:CR=1 FL=1